MHKKALSRYSPPAGRRDKPRPRRTWTAWRPRSWRSAYTWHPKKQVWGTCPHGSWYTYLGPSEAKAERQINVICCSSYKSSQSRVVTAWYRAWQRHSTALTNILRAKLEILWPTGLDAGLWLVSTDQRQFTHGNLQSLLISRGPIPHATHGTPDLRSRDLASLAENLSVIWTEKYYLSF